MRAVSAIHCIMDIVGHKFAFALLDVSYGLRSIAREDDDDG